MKKSAKFDPNFYRFPRNPEWTIVMILMFIFYLAINRPESLILDYLGPVGRLARYLHYDKPALMYTILYAAMVTHAGEAVYTFYICQQLGLNTLPTILWMTQNMMFGFPSLTMLLSNRVTVLVCISVAFFCNIYIVHNMML